MTAELELGRNPAEIIRGFDADPYSDEEPNALVVEQAQAFLAAMREDYPQHYAMTLLGFVTGLRPSSLRSLRRVEDVLWDEGAILVRRSNARGQVVAERTKTGRRQRIHLPESVMQTLREHVALLKHPPISPVFKQPPMWWRKPMADSPLLFPARTGGFRSRSCLDKPFADVCKTAGITHAFTPRGMRRTFQDLARAAEVHDVVTRSISGHATTRMHEHYSTAAANEQRTAVAKVIDLVSRRRAAG
jgi:integrase